ncbi:MAG TPA: hypothetical protein VIH78_09015 [Terriglobales bacterium]
MNRRCSVTKRVETSKGRRYCPVVLALAANGRIWVDVVLVNGAPERHTEGAYHLEWREGPKRVWLSVGKDAELNAVNRGAAIVPESQKPCVSSFARSATALRQSKKSSFGLHPPVENSYHSRSSASQAANSLPSSTNSERRSPRNALGPELTFAP